MTRSCVMVSSKKASRISRSRSRPTRWRGRCAPCWTGLDAPPPPCGSPGTASIHHSGRPRGSDVRGDQIRASFIHFASGCTLHNPGTPGYLRAPMAESVAANLAAVQGITVGHWTDLRTWTGCTVVLAPVGGMRAACALRGRATGTREIDALDPRHLVGHIDAVLLTGGSAYGLGAADGVMRWLKERGRGFPVGPAGVVPIVPTAVIFDFDLAPGAKADRWPGADDAYRACAAAATEIPEGSVGAGTGATVGKALGPRGAMKGGVGTWAARAGDVVVGALVVLNAVGNVLDANGRVLAGARGADGRFVDALGYLAQGGAPFARGGAGQNTTLAVVATNARLDRVALQALAHAAGDALARRIVPYATPFDGDVVFALSTAQVPAATPLQAEALAALAVPEAVERAVRLARGVRDIPGLADQDREA